MNHVVKLIKVFWSNIVMSNKGTIGNNNGIPNNCRI